MRYMIYVSSLSIWHVLLFQSASSLRKHGYKSPPWRIAKCDPFKHSATFWQNTSGAFGAKPPGMLKLSSWHFTEKSWGLLQTKLAETKKRRPLSGKQYLVVRQLYSKPGIEFSSDLLREAWFFVFAPRLDLIFENGFIFNGHQSSMTHDHVWPRRAPENWCRDVWTTSS